MSYSSDVKEELARLMPKERHCRVAELAAVMRFAGDTGPEGTGVCIRTDHVVPAKKYYTLLKRTFCMEIGLEIKEEKDGARGRRYRISIDDPDAAEEFLAAVCYADDAGLEAEVLAKSCCRRAFLRGAFLAAGSVSNPGKSYHFEIVCRDERQAEQICALICEFPVTAKIVPRKNRHVVYVKESDGIVDMLNVMGAHKSAMEFENVRIIKDMRNSANRQYNCDSANINKTVQTSARQLEAIRLIERTAGLNSLPPSLKEMAQVRLAHPEESLQGLGEYLNPPVGKSGVNHRLRKLEQIASQISE